MNVAQDDAIRHDTIRFMCDVCLCVYSVYKKLRIISCPRHGQGFYDSVFKFVLGIMKQ